MSDLAHHSTDLRRVARHGSPRFTADDLEQRLCHLRRCGFSADQADKVAETIDLPSCAAIDTRLADLRALGFADPVKMITSSPAILGYSRERILLCGEVVTRLADAPPSAFRLLLGKRRSLIDRIAAAAPRTWAEVRLLISAPEPLRSAA